MKLCVLAGVALLAVACGNADGDSPGGPSSTPGSARQWEMPNLVGSNLQDAQDRIQKVTGNPLFLTFSHDASGRDRNQVLDSNWKVCSQNIAAGANFAADARIDFGAVKADEQCP